MRFANIFPRITGFALAAILIVLLSTIETTAQVVISNEKLVATTFVVNKKPTTVSCSQPGCSAKAPILTSIPVTCPAAKGGTCTFHISFDAKITVDLPCGGHDCGGQSDSADSYQFLVDGAAPTPGPTTGEGEYFFARYVASSTLDPSRQSYPASVIATVTNSGSRHHSIDVSLRCVETLKYYGCGAVALWSTLRVDVFQP